MSNNPAGPAVVEMLALDVDRLVVADPEVRADRYDSVHQMRVATRRLRSVLRSYRVVFDRTEVDEVRDELKWLAGVLGVARDAEVMAERYTSLLDDVPSDLVVGPIRDRLVTTQRDAYRAGHADVVRALDSDRYTRLRERLDRLVEEPPAGPRADKSASSVFTKALTKEYNRLRGCVRTEFGATAEGKTDALHEVRKAAKRLRYAAAGARNVMGDSANGVAKDAKRLQSALGDHRDAVESRESILAEASAARSRGEDTLTYGVLYQAEERHAADALAGYPPTLEALTASCSVLTA